MIQDEEKARPIGYWLREADDLLTRFTNRVQLSNGVSRFEWQVLNLVHRTPATRRSDIDAVMLPFMDEQALGAIMTRLSDRGWVETHGAGDPSFRLTEAGERQHGLIRAAQQQVRDVAMGGITGDEYKATINVLRRMVANLRKAAESPHPPA